MGRINGAYDEEVLVEIREPPDMSEMELAGKGIDLFADRVRSA